MTISEMHLLFKLSVDKLGTNALPFFEPEAIDIILNLAIKNVVKNKISGNNALKQGAEETTKRKEDLQSLLREYTLHSTQFLPGLKPYGVIVLLPTDLFYILDEEVCISSEVCSPVITNGKLENGSMYKITEGEIAYPTGMTVHNFIDDTNLFMGTKIKTYSETSTPVKVIQAKRINVLPIRNDQYNSLILDPFNRPDAYKILRLDFFDSSSNRNALELISSKDIDIDKYYLRYYKTPVVVNINTNTDCDLPALIHEEIVDFAVNWVLENIESPRFQTQIINTQRNE